tara:strand:+ start:335 stop:784 length:450 start_codon:yes stop_codon:yes gene_type:complete
MNRNISNNNFPEMGSPIVGNRRNNNNNNNNNNNKNKTNNKHPKNVNVSTFYNKSFMNANKKNIPASKRSFLITNVSTNDKKVKTVYNIRGLTKWLKEHGNSPVSRTPATVKNIKKYPNDLPKPLIVKMKRGPVKRSPKSPPTKKKPRSA